MIIAKVMGKMGDHHIISSAVEKKMSLQYNLGQNYDAKCAFHPLGQSSDVD